MGASEEVTAHNRRFRITVEGPDPLRRYSAVVTDLASGQPLTRNPVRGRSPADARDRAVEVLYNLIGIARFQDQILAVAAALAPGATVDLTEDAQTIRAELSGPWALAAPLAVPRDEVTDPAADPQALRARIEEHFRTHLRRVE